MKEKEYRSRRGMGLGDRRNGREKRDKKRDRVFN